MAGEGSIRVLSSRADLISGGDALVAIAADDPAPRTAPTEDASTEINVDWERRVQFDALRDGNALRQNDVLNRAIRSDK